MRRITTLALLAATLPLACGRGGAYGDANSVIVGAPNELWERVETPTRTALERRVFTVAEEKAFTVTQIDPREADWGNLQQFKQVLVIGEANDPWVAEALAERDGNQALAPPQILQVMDVWARSQLVTVMLLNDGDAAAQVERLLPELAELYERQYRDYVVARMFLTGRDSALADTLRAEAGFELLLPVVYQWRREDSTFIFRNDNPDPSELIRQVAVTWWTPVPPNVQPESLLEWRSDIANRYYEDEQVVKLEGVQGGPGTIGGNKAYQIQATWENPPGGWPAGGPLLMRAIICEEQNRMYLLDAWLYAPGKEKYEYVIQLETILNSFRCGT
ncbi:MAG: DUF4837 family protein [Gemmatimonadota bacterium]|nr:DUF4837 family protein [Gemmatimonadota bacterium]